MVQGRHHHECRRSQRAAALKEVTRVATSCTSTHFVRWKDTKKEKGKKKEKERKRQRKIRGGKQGKDEDAKKEKTKSRKAGKKG